MKNRLAAIAAGAALALAATLMVATPADAYVCYPNTVRNNSLGEVKVINAYGSILRLIGYGSKTTNVNWVRVTAGSTVKIGLSTYYGYGAGYDVRVTNCDGRNIYVARIS